MSHIAAEGFQCNGIDLSQAMLRNAQKLNPGAVFHIGDMSNARLGQKFDAVIAHDAW